MWGNSIASRVQRAIKARVERAEELYAEECRALEERCEAAKEEYAEKLVREVIGL